MTTPRFIASLETAIVLAAMQVGYCFIANDWLAVGVRRVGISPFIWMASLLAVITVVLAWNLSGRSRGRGYSGMWAAMAVLSLIGVAVVYCLPDRASVRRGFPIKPTTPEKT